MGPSEAKLTDLKLSPRHEIWFALEPQEPLIRAAKFSSQEPWDCISMGYTSQLEAEALRVVTYRLFGSQEGHKLQRY